MYVNLATLEILTIQQLQELFPLTGFPPDVGNEALLEYGFAVLEYDPYPEVVFPDSYAEGPVRLEGGRAYQEWVVVPATLSQWLAINTAELERLQRLANAQVTALQGRVNTLDYLINQQDPDDEDYIEPSAAEIADLPVRKAQLKSWNSYNVKLGRVSTQAAWPSAPVWPVQPEPYTNETSAVVQPAT
jgi:hypothetical protein